MLELQRHTRHLGCRACHVRSHRFTTLQMLLREPKWSNNSFCLSVSRYIFINFSRDRKGPFVWKQSIGNSQVYVLGYKRRSLKNPTHVYLSKRQISDKCHKWLRDTKQIGCVAITACV